MTILILKLFAVAGAVILVAFSAIQAFRNARRLDRRIKEFKQEQEALRQQGKILDPYAAMAELYAEEMPAPRGPTRGSKEARRAQRYDREAKSRGDDQE